MKAVKKAQERNKGREEGRTLDRQGRNREFARTKGFRGELGERRGRRAGKKKGVAVIEMLDPILWNQAERTLQNPSLL
jgi:hypothetical protein